VPSFQRFSEKTQNNAITACVEAACRTHAMPSTEAPASGSVARQSAAGTSSPSSDEGPAWRDSSRSSEPLTRLRPQPAGTDSNTNTGSQHTGSGNGSGGDSGGDGSRSGRSSDNSDTAGHRAHGRTQPRTNAHRALDAWSDTNAVRGTPVLPTAPAAPNPVAGAVSLGTNAAASDEPLPPALLPHGALQRPRRESRTALGSPEAGSNLFVAGMPSTVDDESLAAAFAPYGTVLSAKVMLHVDTAASRGFGFVLFARAAEAERAMNALQGTAIAGHGGRLQVSVSKHRGENLTAESRVVYIRNLPAALLGSDELAAFLGGFGPVDRVTSRPGNDAQHGGAPNCTNAVVTFGSVEAARACVAACHGKRPFAQCVVPLLSKMEEPQTLREQRLREQRSLRPAARGSGGRTSGGNGAAASETRGARVPRSRASDAATRAPAASASVAPRSPDPPVPPLSAPPAATTSAFAPAPGAFTSMGGAPIPAYGAPPLPPFGYPLFTAPFSTGPAGSGTSGVQAPFPLPFSTAGVPGAAPLPYMYPGGLPYPPPAAGLPPR